MGAFGSSLLDAKVSDALLLVTELGRIFSAGLEDRREDDKTPSGSSPPPGPVSPPINQDQRKSIMFSLIHNEPFWRLATGIRHDAKMIDEIIGYISALLNESLVISAIALRMLLPSFSSQRRQLVLRVIKLPTIARVLKSRAFWHLVLDREWLTSFYSIDLALGQLNEEIPKLLRLFQSPEIGKVIHSLGQDRSSAIKALTTDAAQLLTLLQTYGHPLRTNAPAPPILLVLLHYLTLPSSFQLLNDDRLARVSTKFINWEGTQWGGPNGVARGQGSVNGASRPPIDDGTVSHTSSRPRKTQNDTGSEDNSSTSRRRAEGRKHKQHERKEQGKKRQVNKAEKGTEHDKEKEGQQSWWGSLVAMIRGRSTDERKREKEGERINREVKDLQAAKEEGEVERKHHGSMGREDDSDSTYSLPTDGRSTASQPHQPSLSHTLLYDAFVECFRAIDEASIKYRDGIVCQHVHQHLDDAQKEWKEMGPSKPTHTTAETAKTAQLRNTDGWMGGTGEEKGKRNKSKSLTIEQIEEARLRTYVCSVSGAFLGLFRALTECPSHLQKRQGSSYRVDDDRTYSPDRGQSGCHCCKGDDWMDLLTLLRDHVDNVMDILLLYGDAFVPITLYSMGYDDSLKECMEIYPSNLHQQVSHLHQSQKGASLDPLPAASGMQGQPTCVETESQGSRNPASDLASHANHGASVTSRWLFQTSLLLLLYEWHAQDVTEVKKCTNLGNTSPGAPLASAPATANSARALVSVMLDKSLWIDMLRELQGSCGNYHGEERMNGKGKGEKDMGSRIGQPLDFVGMDLQSQTHPVPPLTLLTVKALSTRCATKLIAIGREQGEMCVKAALYATRRIERLTQGRISQADEYILRTFTRVSELNHQGLSTQQDHASSRRGLSSSCPLPRSPTPTTSAPLFTPGASSHPSDNANTHPTFIRSCRNGSSPMSTTPVPRLIVDTELLGACIAFLSCLAEEYPEPSLQLPVSPISTPSSSVSSTHPTSPHSFRSVIGLVGPWFINAQCLSPLLCGLICNAAQSSLLSCDIISNAPAPSISSSSSTTSSSPSSFSTAAPSPPFSSPDEPDQRNESSRIASRLIQLDLMTRIANSRSLIRLTEAPGVINALSETGAFFSVVFSPEFSSFLSFLFTTPTALPVSASPSLPSFLEPALVCRFTSLTDSVRSHLNLFLSPRFLVPLLHLPIAHYAGIALIRQSVSLGPLTRTFHHLHKQLHSGQPIATPMTHMSSNLYPLTQSDPLTSLPLTVHSPNSSSPSIPSHAQLQCSVSEASALVSSAPCLSAWMTAREALYLRALVFVISSIPSQSSPSSSSCSPSHPSSSSSLSQPSPLISSSLYDSLCTLAHALTDRSAIHALQALCYPSSIPLMLLCSTKHRDSFAHISLPHSQPGTSPSASTSPTHPHQLATSPEEQSSHHLSLASLPLLDIPESILHHAAVYALSRQDHSPLTSSSGANHTNIDHLSATALNNHHDNDFHTLPPHLVSSVLRASMITNSVRTPQSAFAFLLTCLPLSVIVQCAPALSFLASAAATPWLIDKTDKPPTMRSADDHSSPSQFPSTSTSPNNLSSSFPLPPLPSTSSPLTSPEPTPSLALRMSYLTSLLRTYRFTYLSWLFLRVSTDTRPLALAVRARNDQEFTQFAMRDPTLSFSSVPSLPLPQSTLPSPHPLLPQLHPQALSLVRFFRQSIFRVVGLFLDITIKLHVLQFVDSEKKDDMASAPSHTAHLRVPGSHSDTYKSGDHGVPPTRSHRPYAMTDWLSETCGLPTLATSGNLQSTTNSHVSPLSRRDYPSFVKASRRASESLASTARINTPSIDPAHLSTLSNHVITKCLVGEGTLCQYTSCLEMMQSYPSRASLSCSSFVLPSSTPASDPSSTLPPLASSKPPLPSPCSIYPEIQLILHHQLRQLTTLAAGPGSKDTWADPLDIDMEDGIGVNNTETNPSSEYNIQHSTPLRGQDSQDCWASTGIDLKTLTDQGKHPSSLSSLERFEPMRSTACTVGRLCRGACAWHHNYASLQDAVYVSITTILSHPLIQHLISMKPMWKLFMDDTFWSLVTTLKGQSPSQPSNHSTHVTSVYSQPSSSNSDSEFTQVLLTPALPSSPQSTLSVAQPSDKPQSATLTTNNVLASPSLPPTLNVSPAMASKLTSLVDTTRTAVRSKISSLPQVKVLSKLSLISRTFSHPRLRSLLGTCLTEGDMNLCPALSIAYGVFSLRHAYHFSPFPYSLPIFPCSSLFCPMLGHFQASGSPQYLASFFSVLIALFESYCTPQLSRTTTSPLPPISPSLPTFMTKPTAPAPTCNCGSTISIDITSTGHLLLASLRSRLSHLGFQQMGYQMTAGSLPVSSLTPAATAPLTSHHLGSSVNLLPSPTTNRLPTFLSVSARLDRFESVNSRFDIASLLTSTLFWQRLLDPHITKLMALGRLGTALASLPLHSSNRNQQGADTSSSSSLHTTSLTSLSAIASSLSRPLHLPLPPASPLLLKRDPGRLVIEVKQRLDNMRSKWKGRRPDINVSTISYAPNTTTRNTRGTSPTPVSNTFTTQPVEPNLPPDAKQVQANESTDQQGPKVMDDQMTKSSLASPQHISSSVSTTTLSRHHPLIAALVELAQPVSLEEALQSVKQPNSVSSNHLRLSETAGISSSFHLSRTGGELGDTINGGGGRLFVNATPTSSITTYQMNAIIDSIPPARASL